MNATRTDSVIDCDIAVVGAGPVGLAFAISLAKRSATAALSVVLVDARDADAAALDPRVLALSHGSRVLLEPLGWPKEITPIERIHVSQRGHFGRAEIDRSEHDLPALGYVVRYGVIAAALRAGLDKAIAAGANVRIIDGYQACDAEQVDDGVTLQLVQSDVASKQATASAPASQSASQSTSQSTSQSASQPASITVRARLLVHAEGGLFRPRQQDPHEETGDADTRGATAAKNTPSSRIVKAIRSRDYQQTAIVGAVKTDAPLPRVAWERFTEEGPIALLPLAESGGTLADYAVVWCQSPEKAAARMQLSDQDFLSELGTAFGARVGRFTRIEGRAAFPLGLNARVSLVDRRAASIGNAAQTLHPVAGQGLNLGLRDAQALGAALGLHGATPEALADFARRRRIDRSVTVGMTDALAHGFTIDLAPLSLLRGAALSALDLVPGAKSLLARQMMFGQRR
jgi:2-octaprenyl-6-methoxyphenol hydroxylase